MKKLILVSVIVIFFGVAGFLFFYHKTTSTPQKSADSYSKKTELAGFDKQQYSLDDPTSQWLIVNKQRPIPITFKPEITVPDVRLRLSATEEQMHINIQTALATKEMFDAAKNDGVELVFGSGYRSAATQKGFYDAYVARDGVAAADTYSARPGHSEHQTGFAFDITSPNGKCHLEICWADTPEGQWLALHAHEYGFVIRYPTDKQAITGYQYEPWHVRFVGKDLAQEIHKLNQTLEEFFGLPAGPTMTEDIRL